MVVQASIGLRAVVWSEQMAVAEGQKADAEAALQDQGVEEAEKQWEEACVAMQQQSDNVRRRDVCELMAFCSPPSRCLEIAEVICRLFIVKPDRVHDPHDPRRRVNAWWVPFNRCVREPGFMMRLRDYLHETRIEDKHVRPVRDQLQMMDEDRGVERTKFISTACYHLHCWAVSFVRYWDGGGEHGVPMMRANRRLNQLRAVRAISPDYC